MARYGSPCAEFVGKVLCLIFIFKQVLTFNVDTKAPIVKHGSPESYFGYSLAFHLTKNRRTDRVTTVILVGAPRDNITDSSVTADFRSLNRPGLVYQCPYDSQIKCDPLKIDQQGEIGQKETRDDMWMGVSVASQMSEEGSAVACAHRFKSVGTGHRWGLGICYQLTNSLDMNEFLTPCQGRSMNKGHEEYGFCQAGTSSTINKNGDLMMGVPGIFTWKGGVFKKSLIDDLEADSQWYWSPVEESPSITRSYSYLGMSVKTGYLFEDSTLMTYVGGAPRSEDTGEVLLFQQTSTTSLLLEIKARLKGKQFGSYFGYDIAIVDVNGDKRQDLIVGAPFYRGPGIGGAIYVFLNKEAEGITSRTKSQMIESRKMRDQECLQLDCQNARFGFALASIGDIDQDGYNDIAVGAPYEGSGAVYIFLGSPNGLKDEPSQRIYAKQISNEPLHSFGASLAGDGADVDGNEYPDLAIGAFASSRVYLLRSRPVIKVEHVFQGLPAIIDPTLTQCTKDGADKNCFSLRLCFKLVEKSVNKFLDKVFLNFTIEAERFAGALISRVFFKETNKDVITRTIQLSFKDHSNLKCVDPEPLVYLAKNIKDFLNPIPFKLTYQLANQADPVQTPGGPLPDMNNYPVLDETATKPLLSIPFKKNCGTDEKCDSNLKIKSSLSLHLIGEKQYKLRVGIDNEVSLKVQVINDGEEAHEATVYVELPRGLRYIGTNESKEVSCAPSVEDDLLIFCSIGNPFPEKGKTQFNIRLDPKEALASKDKLSIALAVNTTSNELDPKDNQDSIQLEVVVEADIGIRGNSEPESVFFGGVVKGESAINLEEEIGSEVRHSYEIKNFGKARVSSSLVIISWPYELQSEHPNGKHLLYLLEEPTVEGDGQCFVDKKYINPLKIRTRLERPKIGASLSANQTRSRRDAENRKERSIFSNELSLDCDLKTARCFVFNCTIGELRPGHSFVIKLRSRLWNSTFLEDFPNKDAVKIFSKAELKIDPKLNIKQVNEDNDVLKIVTVAIPEVQESPGVPLWVIIVSVLAGVLLLILLILLLWKCGFFKRSRRDQIATHKAKMQRRSYED